MNKNPIFDASAYGLRQPVMLFDNNRHRTLNPVSFLVNYFNFFLRSGLHFANTV
jgi:hypothetical protein